MPDVLKIAQERRAALLKEVSALDRFIEMAHSLLASASAANAGGSVQTKPVGGLKPTPVANQSATVKPLPTSQTETFLQSRNVSVAKQAAQQS